jgi:acyl-CoA synthetase (NDP forming)
VRAHEFIAAATKSGLAALDERAGKALLAAYGVAVPRSVVVPGAAEAATALAELRFPVVVKVMSQDILHKSDAGGVRVGLATAAEVKQAIRDMMGKPVIAGARVEGFLVEEMAPPGQEMVVGAVRDPHFGPLLMVGLGGIFVEILADVSFRICPISRLDAEEMLDELKGAPLLRGARGRKPVDRAAIIDVLLKVGGPDGLLMAHGGDIAEADINPVIVSEQGAVAVDARFVLKKSFSSPIHGSL